MTSVKVLVACEFSGIVRDAFRAKGHDAYSCDLLESERPSKYHIKDDVLKHLKDGWDMMIAHPPCQYLAVSGARWFKDRLTEQAKALDFVKALMDAPIDKICIENPISIISSRIRTPDQIIQPWYFGHDYSKKTCLWLKNLPELKPTKVIQISYITTKNGHKYTKGWYEMPRTSVARSRTFQGVADAMAEQWG